MLEAIAYVIVCLFTGLCGIDRRMGFAGTFLIALVTAALVALPLSPARRGASNGAAELSAAA